MRLASKILVIASFLSSFTLLTSCGAGGGGSDGPRIYYGEPAKLGSSPSVAKRAADIRAEPKGDFFYGRRYFVDKTRFWGYIRKPGQSWNSSRLSMINEDYKRQPDRLPESASKNNRYGHDQNYEYQLFGNYTGRTIYDPNSNLFLPEFMLKNYKLLDKKPGWIFNQNDLYNPRVITLRPS